MKNSWLKIGFIDTSPRELLAHLPTHREILVPIIPIIANEPFSFPLYESSEFHMR